SPEQAQGATVESSSDIFSLGIVLYELVTGRHPFQAGSALGMMQAIAGQQPPSPSRLNPEVPRALEGLLEAMLHKDARLRPTASEVATALASLTAGAASSARTVLRQTQRPIVHREGELAALGEALARAEGGAGALICVAGEPGIGKTTLVEDFLESQAVVTGNCLVARGHCSERVGSTEAYVPVMDALQDLLCTQASAAVIRLMKAVAPTWYVQAVPAAQQPSAPEISEASRAFSQPALLRQFRALVEELSHLGPVILFFDDVHWADLST